MPECIYCGEECIYCGEECSFDPNIRHVCAALQEECKEAEAGNPCHYNDLIQKILGGVSITLEEARSCEDRHAMRLLVRNKLQPLGDALLVEMEKHQRAEEKT